MPIKTVFIDIELAGGVSKETLRGYRIRKKEMVYLKRELKHGMRESHGKIRELSVGKLYFAWIGNYVGGWDR